MNSGLLISAHCRFSAPRAGLLPALHNGPFGFTAEAGRVGERAARLRDPLSPPRTGHADFPASGSPVSSRRRLAQAVARLCLTVAAAQIAQAAGSKSLLPADGRAAGCAVSDVA